jgi:hypothetical protein
VTDAFHGWKQRRAAKRVRPGDGRPLGRFRWWQVFSRALFHLRIDEGRTVYAVDVNHWGNPNTGDPEAHLYLDRRHQAVSKLPASFPVAGGSIEVAKSSFGLRRCHFVPTKGYARPLDPDPASAEGRRAALDRAHPAASRWIGRASVAALVVSLALLVPQTIELIAGLPLAAGWLGGFESPIRLPAWLNIAVTAGAAVASSERALRMRYHWLLDGAAN